EGGTYFLLGPLMVGVALLLGRRILNDFGPRMGKIGPADLSDEALLRTVFAFLFLKIFFNFLPLARRLYPVERSLTIEEWLPIQSETRYQLFYLEQLVRDLPFFLIGSWIVLFMGKGDLIGWAAMIWLLFPAVEIGFAFLWIHLRAPNRTELFLALSTLILAVGLLPTRTLETAIDLAAPMLMLAGYWGYGRWRYGDAERVERLLSKARPQSRWLTPILRSLPKGERPLIRRDLLLTFRNSVPVFWRNAAFALTAVLATAVRGKISIFLFCAAAVYLISAVASNLLAQQRPYRLLDFSLPIPYERIWRAKVGYAALLSFPIPWMVWGVEMMVRPAPIDQSLFLLVRLLLVGVSVAMLTGGTICEGDQKPALHHIIAAFLSALAAFFITALHPVLFLLTFPVLSHLQRSAALRLRNEEVA
ncbi:MAG TPA: hypothetical protein VI382_02910, partial [Candidatus Manganitrophaceae bacterium]|nr:hypothetical protein [Candidatus Manganitrophaceae bacterium]